MADQTTNTATETVERFRLESYQVILRPLVTEKGMHRSTRNNQYAFEVHLQASKDDVRRAVEDLFNVKVEKVRTQNRRGKPRRHRFKAGQTKAWKKAIVTLDAEHRIDFF
jgi:large subunit ribosomal protein L23